MAFTGIDHAGFTVSDLDRSIGWYTQLLGVGPVVRKRSDDAYMGAMIGYRGCVLEYAYFPLPGGSKLELLQYSHPASEAVDLETKDVGSGHLCLLVDDLHAEFERLSAIAEFRSPAPVEITAGINRGGFGAYLRDPDGITIQLIQPPAGGQRLPGSDDR